MRKPLVRTVREVQTDVIVPDRDIGEVVYLKGQPDPLVIAGWNSATRVELRNPDRTITTHDVADVEWEDPGPPAP